MFARMSVITAPLTFTFEGKAVRANRGDTVAAALLAAGVKSFRRTPVSNSPRLPHCMIGNCFECLVVVDGVPDRQACLVTVTEGMKVECNVDLSDMEQV